MLNQYQDIITVEELCEILKTGKNRVYELLQTNQIRHSDYGAIGRYLKYQWNIIWRYNLEFPKARLKNNAPKRTIPLWISSIAVYKNSILCYYTTQLPIFPLTSLIFDVFKKIGVKLV